MAGKYFTVRNCLGKYSKWYLVLHGRHKFYKHIRTLEKFFAAFPTKLRLGQFKLEDIDDWAIERRRQVSLATVTIELYRINMFWNWCKDQYGYILPNPVTPIARKVSKKVPRNTKTLSLDELRVICSVIDDSSLQRDIVAHILGLEGYALRANPRILNSAFARAAQAVGMEYKFMDFKRSVPQLRLAILNNLSREVRDALAFKAKLDSGSLTNIELPRVDTVTTYERSPIRYGDKDNLPVLGIGQSQLSTEWQAPVSYS